ncbi:MAG: tetratricopeptide repeat protein [Bacteroidota bacterium]
MQINRHLVALAIAGLFGTTGCTLSKMIKMAKDQELTVKPSPLELHGDSVKWELSAKLPLKMLKKNKMYSVASTYKYSDQKVALPELVLKQVDYPKANVEQPLASRKYGFLYTGETMSPGDLVITGIAANMNNVQKKTPEMTIARGIITTSRLVQDVYSPIYAPHGYNNSEELAPTNVNFFFEQGSSKLRVTETKGGRGSFLTKFISRKNPTKTVVITGYHSPEGKEVRNVKLSEERAKAIEKFYKESMKQYKYAKKADSIQFVTRSVVENWKVFKDSLAVYPGLSQEQKDEVKNLIDNSTDNFVVTEEKLSKLACYPEIFTGLYPKLRTANTEILDIMPKKSDATISLLAKGITEGREQPTALNDRELGYAATMTPLLNEREAIYRAATKKNDSWETHNNLGAVLLEQAKKLSGKDRKDMADKAIIQLEIAKNKEPNATVSANLATAYLMKGDLANAAVAVANGTQLQPNEAARRTLNTVGGILLIKQGKYTGAVNNLSAGVEDAVVSFDRGLAYLLNRDFDKAVTNFEESVTANPNYAPSYYGLAIAAARRKQDKPFIDNLKKAIAIDDNLRARALGDMEFYEYFGSEAFRNAIK